MITKKKFQNQREPIKTQRIWNSGLIVGRGGSLVDSSPFVRIPLYSRHVGIFGKSFTRSCLWRFGGKPLHSIRAVSGAPLSSGGL